MALILKPQLIIADEPTTALDVTIQAQVLRLIRKLRKELHASMLLISHDLGVVQKNCDRLGILYAGGLVEMGTRQHVFSNPLHPYTRGLLAAIPKIKENRDRLSIIPGNLPDIKNLPAGCCFGPRCEHPLAQICTTRLKPPLIEVEPGHWVACYHVTAS
jgi:peptide/nickel transport system ATP-binding protein